MPRIRFATRTALALVVLQAIAQHAAAGEWTKLFDGNSLTGWKVIDGNEGSWGAENGVIFTTGDGSGWLSTEQEYGDFELKLRFKVPKGGNSGVFIRAPHGGNPAFAGLEIQVLDDADPQYASLQPYQYCGSVYAVKAAQPRVTKPAGEWQTLAVRCEGARVVVTLNETQVVDCSLIEYQGLIKEHPGIARRRGYVGLQNHGARVEFADLELRRLD